MKFNVKGLAFGLLALPLLSGSALAEKVRLDVWEQDTPAVGNEMDKWIEVFEKRNPDIDVVRTHYENEQLRTKFLQSAVTGDGADIVYGPNDLAGVLATAGVIQEATPFINKDQFDQATIDVTKLNGKVWGIPLSVGNHLMLFYNKELVKDAPASFDDIIKQGQAFMKQKADGYGLAMYQSEPFWFVPFMGAFGAWPLQETDGKVNVTLNTPESVKALQFLVDLKDKYKILPKDCDYQCAKSMFLSKRAPYLITGDWEINDLQDNFGKNLGIAPLPIVNATGKHATPLLGGRYLFVNSVAEGKKLEAAKKFIAFLSELPIQVRIATKLNRIPAVQEARDHKQVKELETLAALADATKYAKASPSDVEMRAAWDGLRIMVQRAMSGKESVAEASKTGQQAADEALSALKTKKKEKTKTH